MPTEDACNLLERNARRQTDPVPMTRIRTLSETEQQTLTDSPRPEKVEAQEDVERSPGNDPGVHWSQAEVYEIPRK